MGVDFGRKRIGIAFGETDPCVATPRPPLAASGKLDTDAATIGRLAAAEQVELIVVGVPELEDASDGGHMQRACRALGARLVDRGLRVEFVDESMTSVESESALHAVGFTAAQRKGRKDGEAAARILERYMDQL